MRGRRSEMLYGGREFTEPEIQWIRDTLESQPRLTRNKLSKLFCEHFRWVKPDGGLKDMSCRLAHLRMAKDGVIRLPEARKGHFTQGYRIERTVLGEPGRDVTVGAGSLEIEIEIVTKTWSSLWNEYIDRYHYLGYTRLTGSQLRYFVKSRGRVVAVLGFGASAWKTEPRDHYIGWSASQREKNLHLIVNNARFLILPWIHSKNLGSHILSKVIRRIGDDWEKAYHYRPVLLETFVEKERFQGTCYKAANWLYVGDTKGRGRQDVKKEFKEPVKSIWIYPLIPSFRRQLCESESSQ